MMPQFGSARKRGSNSNTRLTGTLFQSNNFQRLDKIIMNTKSVKAFRKFLNLEENDALITSQNFQAIKSSYTNFSGKFEVAKNPFISPNEKLVAVALSHTMEDKLDLRKADGVPILEYMCALCVFCMKPSTITPDVYSTFFAGSTFHEPEDLQSMHNMNLYTSEEFNMRGFLQENPLVDIRIVREATWQQLKSTTFLGGDLYLAKAIDDFFTLDTLPSVLQPKELEESNNKRRISRPNLCPFTMSTRLKWIKVDSSLTIPTAQKTFHLLMGQRTKMET